MFNIQKVVNTRGVMYDSVVHQMNYALQQYSGATTPIAARTMIPGIMHIVPPMSLQYTETSSQRLHTIHNTLRLLHGRNKEEMTN